MTSFIRVEVNRDEQGRARLISPMLNSMSSSVHHSNNTTSCNILLTADPIIRVPSVGTVAQLIGMIISKPLDRINLTNPLLTNRENVPSSCQLIVTKVPLHSVWLSGTAMTPESIEASVNPNLKVLPGQPDPVDGISPLFQNGVNSVVGVLNSSAYSITRES